MKTGTKVKPPVKTIKASGKRSLTASQRRNSTIRSNASKTKLVESEIGLKQSKFDKSLQKQSNALSKQNIKLERQKAKNTYRQRQLEANSKRGGPIGYLARRKVKRNAKFDADLEMIKNEPKLSAKERIARIDTNAAVKKTKAKGAAFATAATALGTAYTQGKEAESKAAIEQAKADYESAKTLNQGLAKMKDVDIDSPYDSKNSNTAGLTDGVR